MKLTIHEVNEGMLSIFDADQVAKRYKALQLDGSWKDLLIKTDRVQVPMYPSPGNDVVVFNTAAPEGTEHLIVCWGILRKAHTHNPYRASGAIAELKK